MGDVEVAEQLLDELDKTVTEADLDIDPSLIGELVLESLMHSCGGMVQEVGSSIKVFGRKDAVAKACQHIQEYVANPHSNVLMEAKSKMPPRRNLPARSAPLPTPTASSKGPERDDGHNHNDGTACITCGAANFCPCCGAQVGKHWDGSPTNFAGQGPTGKDGVQTGRMPAGYQLMNMPADMQQAMDSTYMPVQYMPSGMGGQAIWVPQGMALQTQKTGNSYAYTM